MLSQAQLARTRFPIGDLTKADVRQLAGDLGLRTAAKPDSQDVCFISRTGGRAEFLGSRMAMHPATVLDDSGAVIGRLPAVELITVGQRRGLGALASLGADAGPGPLESSGRRYVVDVDVTEATVTVGSLGDLLVGDIAVRDPVWVDGPPAAEEPLDVQVSAHGRPVAATWSPDGIVTVATPIRRVAAGQSVVLYRGDTVVGGGAAA
jgi:tRNA-specific 2-thiouridylase